VWNETKVSPASSAGAHDVQALAKLEQSFNMYIRELEAAEGILGFEGGHVVAGGDRKE
jgi:hypothetical protein